MAIMQNFANIKTSYYLYCLNFNFFTVWSLASKKLVLINFVLGLETLLKGDIQANQEQIYKAEIQVSLGLKIFANSLSYC